MAENDDSMLMLGIESSCDETSVALLNGEGEVRANLIASQIERHQPFGGVVPEIASREHLDNLMPLMRKALADSGKALGDVTAVSVTCGPGLIGALLVGVAAAQGLAYGLGIPLIPVNHLEGHVFSPFLRSDGSARALPPRFFSLVVSGGHSSVYEVTADGEQRSIRMLNRTRDDAAGEVFDKVGKFVGLPYPGGPHIEKTAKEGDPERFRFPLARFKDDSVDFSFSGLKSNAIRLARQLGLEAAAGGDGSGSQVLADFCASFQKAIGDQILDRLGKLWDSRERASRPALLALAGGVAANGDLRERIGSWCSERGVEALLPERRYCTDNAAMIAFAGLQRWRSGEVSGDPRRVPAYSRMPLGASDER
ncbi:MAG: tRNA (adenosine(37)-N6)-threonylcarbamoyltransferase complex transferase subunit TsaD [Thermoanaerobaculia bacterium]